MPRKRDSLLSRILPIPPEETRTVLIMGAYFFLAMVCVNLIKSLQSALYLGRVGFDWRLPAMYIALAAISGPLVVLYRSLTRRFSHILITAGTVMGLALTAGMFAILLPRTGPWLTLAFYVWAGIFTVVLPTQGWIISYDLYTTGRAKRMFAVLGAGGIVGGAAGGIYTFLAANFFSSETLLLQAVLALAALAGLLLAAHWTNRKRLRRPVASAVGEPPPEERASLPGLLESHHLTCLLGLVLFSGLTTTLVDLQYKWALDRRFPGAEAEIAQFFGALLGLTSLASLLFQLTATRTILQQFGAGVGLAVLPLALAGGSLGVVLFAGFWSVVLVKAIIASLSTSVDRTSVELMYVPLPPAQILTLKNFMELVVFRMGDGLGATIFLIAAALLSEPLQMVGGLVVVLALLWWAVSRRLGEEYVLTLRGSLESRAAALRRAFDFGEAVTEESLITALRSANSNKIHFALRLLAENQFEKEDYRDFTARSMEISLEMSEVRQSPPRWLDRVADLVEHPDPHIGATALHLMLRHQPDEYESRLRSALRFPRMPPMLYLTYLDEHAEEAGSLLKVSRVQQWSREASPEQAVVLARLMASTGNRAYLPVLDHWMQSPDRRLRRVAVRAVGHFADPAYVDLLVAYLGLRWSRRDARKALTDYGAPLVPELSRMLQDENVRISVKREIPHILARLDSPDAREGLFSALYVPDQTVSFRALKGLNRLRKVSGLTFSGESLLPVLQIWTRHYYELLNMKMVLRGQPGEASGLLLKAVRERVDWTLEKIFRGLDLFLPREDAYFSYLGYTSRRQELRENAIELITSRIRGELRQTLLPIFAEPSRERVIRKGRQLFSLPSDLESVLADSLFHGDAWLRCCTIAAALPLGSSRLREGVSRACQDVNPLVRETAKWAIETWQHRE